MRGCLAKQPWHSECTACHSPAHDRPQARHCRGGCGGPQGPVHALRHRHQKWRACRGARGADQVPAGRAAGHPWQRGGCALSPCDALALGRVGLVTVRLPALPYTRVETACFRSSGKLPSAHRRCRRQRPSAVPQARRRASSGGSHARGTLGRRHSRGGGARLTAHTQPTASVGRAQPQNVLCAGCSRPVLSRAGCSAALKSRNVAAISGAPGA
jgi:hypothetical protein